MGSAKFLVGDVFERMAELEDGSVDLVLTSPPFLALRSYLPADHPDKGKEIGSEPTPAAFLDTLLALTAEWRRLLAPHGSICVELGDTYSGSGGAGGDYNALGMRANQPTFRQSRSGRTEDAWPLAKSLCGIPTLYAWSLAYGRNLLRAPLSGRELLREARTFVEQTRQAGGDVDVDELLAWLGSYLDLHEEIGPTLTIEPWRVRNLVAWVRPNPPVGALGDKFRPATSYMTVACVGRSRYFDLDAVRSEPSEWTRYYAERPYPGSDKAVTESTKDGPRSGGLAVAGDLAGKNIALQGAPPLDWWEIPTHPYPGSHYATWPPALCVRPILAMCPQRVCTTCGKSDCGHDSWRPGRVLDPFAGSGTTLSVATGHGRDAIGIDLDARNAELARERVGMFLDVEDSPAVVDVPPSEEVA